MEQFLTFDRFIAFHRNKLDYQPSPLNSLQLAFEDRRFFKLTNEIDNDQVSDILRFKSLTELNEDFRCAEMISLALLSSDVIQTLIKQFKHQNDEIRELSNRAIKQICSNQHGREQIIKLNVLNDIVALIHDSVQQIRMNAYDGMLHFVEFTMGIDALLQTDIVIQLIDKTVEERDEQILLKALTFLHRLLDGRDLTVQILKTPIISRLSNLFQHTYKRINERAILCICSMSFNEQGKYQVVQQKVVALLCDKLNDQDEKIREAVTITLASLAQLKQGKIDMLQKNIYPQIESMLNEDSEEIRLNVVQLISSISEHPQGRQLAQSCLPKLNSMLNDQKAEYLYPYITQTIEVITWLP